MAVTRKKTSAKSANETPKADVTTAGEVASPMVERGQSAADDLEKKLLADIFAAPDDDAPRLVYADWLLEHGDAERGELIQIQCALGRPAIGAKAHPHRFHPDAKNPPTREELEAREKKLLQKHQKAWLAPIRPFIRVWTWRRGFVDTVEADGATFLKGAATVFANTPLTRADLTGLKKDQLELIPKTPELLHLPELSLSQQRIGPKQAHIFLTPYLKNVRTLFLYRNPLGDEGVTTLASAEHLDSLRVLSIACCGAMAPGLEALSKSKFFPRLTTLIADAEYAYQDPERVAVPQAVDFFVRGESLVALSLERLRVGDAGAKQIASAASLSKLEDLDLRGNDVGDEGAMALARSTHLKSLKTVRRILPIDGPITAGFRALQERLGTDNVT